MDVFRKPHNPHEKMDDFRRYSMLKKSTIARYYVKHGCKTPSSATDRNLVLRRNFLYKKVVCSLSWPLRHQNRLKITMISIGEERE